MRYDRLMLLIVFWLSTDANRSPQVWAKSTIPVAHELSRESPDFLTKNQLLDDLTFFEKMIRTTYGRYDLLQREGLEWKTSVESLRQIYEDTEKMNSLIGFSINSFLF